MVNTVLPLILILELLSSVFLRVTFWLNIIAVLMILLLFIQLLLIRNVKNTDIFILSLTLILILLSFDITRVSILCVYTLFSLKNYYSRKTVKNCLIASVICLSLIVVAYLLFGFNKGYDTQIYRPLTGMTVYRMCFGFSHPNQFTIYLIACTIMVYLITAKFYVHTLITAVDYIFFNYTQSRTALCVVLFLYITIAIVRLLKLKDIRRRIVPAIFCLFIIGSIVLSLCFAGSKLDVLLTGRLALNKKYLGTGLTLFGSKAFDDLPFDNSYIHMIVTKGLIYSVVYCFLLLKELRRAKFNWFYLLIITAVFLEAFMEVILLKYCFMMIIPFVCKGDLKFNYDTKKNTLLLVRQCSKI